MSAINDGGPAFPFAVAVGGAAGIVTNEEMNMNGLSVRDYFAAKAIQGGYCSSRKPLRSQNQPSGRCSHVPIRLRNGRCNVGSSASVVLQKLFLNQRTTMNIWHKILITVSHVLIGLGCITLTYPMIWDSI